jgi:hypothetical protein
VRSDGNSAKKHVSYSKYGVYGIATLCVPLLLVLPSCEEAPEPAGSPTSPPDLSRCTRVEIHYRPSTIEYFFASPNAQSVLRPAELRRLRSLETIVADDQEGLKALGLDLGVGFYEQVEGLPATNRAVHVVCYHNRRRLTSFVVFGSLIMTDDRRWFVYPEAIDLSATLYALTPQIWPFKLRTDCAHNLWYLRSHLSWLLGDEEAYPVPSEWCDAIARYCRTRHYSEERIRKLFKCPGAGQGQSNYAMNPHCKPDSPPDTVCLFETKAGWNQHGGPELFTFDNHEPRGGCVLLNDETLRFIRTQRELDQLRWK